MKICCGNRSNRYLLKYVSAIIVSSSLAFRRLHINLLCFLVTEISFFCCVRTICCPFPRICGRYIRTDISVSRRVIRARVLFIKPLLIRISDALKPHWNDKGNRLRAGFDLLRLRQSSAPLIPSIKSEKL